MVIVRKNKHTYWPWELIHTVSLLSIHVSDLTTITIAIKPQREREREDAFDLNGGMVAVAYSDATKSEERINGEFARGAFVIV